MLKRAAFLIGCTVLTILAGCPNRHSAPTTATAGGLAASDARLAAFTPHVTVTPKVEQNVGNDATEKFTFPTIRPPVPYPQNNVSKEAVFTTVGTVLDTTALNNGIVPKKLDDPDKNFHFPGNGTRSEAGRVFIKLMKKTNIKEFNSYSWGSANRDHQAYTLYGWTGNVDPTPNDQSGELDNSGWTVIGTVDTRRVPLSDKVQNPQLVGVGSQFAVSFSSSSVLGNFQYLLMVVSQTAASTNTYYSEVTIIEAPDGLNHPPGLGRDITPAPRQAQ